MKKILTFVFIMNSLLFAIDDDNSDKKSRVEKQIKQQMEKEKKYAKEQIFYTGEDYDLKEAEVNEDSLSSVPAIEPEDDFDMDSVYD